MSTAWVTETHCSLTQHNLLLACLSMCVQYGEFRTGFNGDTDDTRILVWGQRYILENYVMRQWTEEDVERADIFYRCACACVCVYLINCIVGSPREEQQRRRRRPGTHLHVMHAYSTSSGMVFAYELARSHHWP